MGIKPRIEVLPPQRFNGPTRGNVVPVAMPPQMVMVPPPFPPPRTLWGAKRQVNKYNALRDIANARTGYLQAYVGEMNSVVAATQAVNEVAELPEICAGDTAIRRLQRERDFWNTLTEVEQARYGCLGTQDQIEKLRVPQMTKALPNNAVIDALMKLKVDKEARGEDTTELDQIIKLLPCA